MRCGRYVLICVVVVLQIGMDQANSQSSAVVGYAGRWTNKPGQPAEFYLSGPDNPAAELTIYDVNSQAVATITTPLFGQHIANDNTAPWENGMGYEPTTFTMPDLRSGVYFLDGPTITSTRIPFLIGDPQSPADVVVIYPTNTVNAYTQTRGISLYRFLPDGTRPPAVSFHRTQDPIFKVFRTRGVDRLLIDEGLDVKYIADSDLESYEAIAGSKLVIIPGHSEYWTEGARRNFDRFVELGGSALVVSGNTMFRKVGYDDLENPTQLTFSPRHQWPDERLEYPTWESIGVDYINGGNGSNWGVSREQIDTPYDGWKLLDVSPSYFANTGLQVGDIIDNPTSEYDGVPFTDLDPVTGPVVDTERLGFHEMNLIGFDNTIFSSETPTAGAWVDFRKTADSGRIINVASDTFSLLAGPDGELKRTITKNMINLLLADQADFDRDELLTGGDMRMLFAEMEANAPRMRFDLTEDGLVDARDMERWLYDFAGVPAPRSGERVGDLDLDGIVSAADIDLLTAQLHTAPSSYLVTLDINDDGVFDDRDRFDWISDVADTHFGDADLNGVVDFEDMLIVANSFGKPSGWAGGDFDGNGKSEFSDVLLLGDNFGKRGRDIQRVLAEFSDIFPIGRPSETFGDFDLDGHLTATDIDLLSERMASIVYDEAFDITKDGVVDGRDRRVWVEVIAGTHFGDADLNGAVDFADFLLTANAYGKPGGWAQGDFDGNGSIQFADVLQLADSFAKQNGDFELVSVPEPNAIFLAGLLFSAMTFFRDRRSSIRQSGCGPQTSRPPKNGSVAS